MENRKVSQKWLFLVLGFFLASVLGLAGFFIYQRRQIEQRVVEIRRNLRPAKSPIPTNQPMPINQPIPLPTFSASLPVSLIVGVKIDPPWQPSGNLTPEEEAIQKAAVKKTIDEIISGLDESKVYKRWDTLPYFVVKADEKTLDYLINHPLVKDIQEDEATPLMPSD